MPHSQTKTLHLIGCGLDPRNDLSLQGQRLLKNVDVIITINQTHNILSYLESEGLRAEDISYLYLSDTPRADTYRRVALKVIDYFADNREVAYLTYGHPSILDDICFNLNELATGANIRTVFTSGPSFVEQIFATMRLSLGGAGFAVYDASYAARMKPVINPGAYTLIAQVGALGLATADTTKGIPGTIIDDFCSWLLGYYSPDHMALLCDLMPEPFPSRLASAKISSLPAYAPGFTFATTLCLPPSS